MGTVLGTKGRAISRALNIIQSKGRRQKEKAYMMASSL